MQISIRDGNRASYNVDLSTFNKDVISFGRQPDNDIVLGAGFVSRIHGVFYYEDGTLYIEDLNSTNGLCHMGQKIHKRAVVHGDVILIRGNTGNSNDDVEIQIISAADLQENNQQENYNGWQQGNNGQQHGYNGLQRGNNSPNGYNEQQFDHNGLQESYNQQNNYNGQQGTGGLYNSRRQKSKSGQHYNTDGLGMKWYKFQIWVQIPLSVVVSFLMGLWYLYISNDGGRNSSEFDLYEELGLSNPVDNFYNQLRICAVIHFIIMGMYIYIRYMMAGYKKNAFRCYALMFLFALLFGVCRTVKYDIYILAGPRWLAHRIYVGEVEIESELYRKIAIYVACMLVYLALNVDYYNKRKHLFAN